MLRILYIVDVDWIYFDRYEKNLVSIQLTDIEIADIFDTFNIFDNYPFWIWHFFKKSTMLTLEPDRMLIGTF